MFTRDSIIIHLGKNPKNGGKPPKDNSDKNRINLITVLLLNNINIWLIWNNLKLLNRKIIVNERKEYSKKYIIHKFSLLNIPAIIQPKWPIEEKAINLRKEVWFKPPIAPINTERIIIINKNPKFKQ